KLYLQKSWNTTLIYLWYCRSARSFALISPSRISPSVGLYSLQSNLINVLLPAPFNPTMATTFPSGRHTYILLKVGLSADGYVKLTSYNSSEMGIFDSMVTSVSTVSLATPMRSNKSNILFTKILLWLTTVIPAVTPCILLNTC